MFFNRNTGEGLAGGNVAPNRQSEIDQKLKRVRTIVLTLVTLAFLGLGFGLTVFANREHAWIWFLCPAVITGLAAVTSFAYER